VKASASAKPKKHPITAIDSELEQYCASHPGSPATVQHPQITVDRGRYVAVLGKSIRRGFLGFGSSVSSALRSFDELYSRSNKKS